MPATTDEGRRLREVRRSGSSRIRRPAKARSGRRRDPDQGACHDGDGGRVPDAARTAALGPAHPRCAAASATATQAGPGAGRRSGVRRQGCAPVRYQGQRCSASPVLARAPTPNTSAWRNRVRWRSCRPTSVSTTPRRWSTGRRRPCTFCATRLHVRPGQRVLINGASGSIGTYAVQLARYFGAEVTAVCSVRNAELVRSLGADHVIDYTVEDFTRRRDHYDVIFDTIGASSFARCRGALTEGWPLPVDDGIGQLATHVVDRGSRRPKGHHRDVRRQA